MTTADLNPSARLIDAEALGLLCRELQASGFRIVFDGAGKRQKQAQARWLVGQLAIADMTPLSDIERAVEHLVNCSWTLSSAPGFASRTDGAALVRMRAPAEPASMERDSYEDALRHAGIVAKCQGHSADLVFDLARGDLTAVVARSGCTLEAARTARGMLLWMLGRTDLLTAAEPRRRSSWAARLWTRITARSS